MVSPKAAKSWWGGCREHHCLAHGSQEAEQGQHQEEGARDQAQTPRPRLCDLPTHPEHTLRGQSHADQLASKCPRAALWSVAFVDCHGLHGTSWDLQKHIPRLSPGLAVDVLNLEHRQ